MTTITKEEAQAVWDLSAGYTLGNADVEILQRLARIALASLTAEPVAWRYRTTDINGNPRQGWSFSEEESLMGLYQPLYAAPSAPVVPPERPADSSNGDDVEAWFDEGWNACRAAMLQGNHRDLSQPVDPQVAEYESIMLQAGNSPVTPDSWISCSERMPAQDDWILIYSKHGEYMAGQVQGEYVELSDGTLSWLGNALFWMPLPEPPQEVK